MLDSQSNWKWATFLTGSVSAGLLAKIAWTKFAKRDQNLSKIPDRWIRVGQVSDLTIHPVKSCQGIKVQEATATILGIQGSDFLRDRVFLVGTSEGHFRTARRLPKMILVGTAIHEDELTLTAPDLPSITIKIPEQNEHNIKSCKVFSDSVKYTLDCGDQVGEWLSNFLEEKNLRLFYHVGDKTQRVMNSNDKRFPAFVPTDKGAFHDETSYMMMSEESLVEVNQNLEVPLPMKNFRPSITIKGLLEPFAEELWSFVRIGDDSGPVFKYVEPCARCRMTMLNPSTATFSSEGEPVKTLQKMTRSFGNETVNSLVKGQGILGVHMGLVREGRRIKVDDPVYAALL